MKLQPQPSKWVATFNMGYDLQWVATVTAGNELQSGGSMSQWEKDFSSGETLEKTDIHCK